MPVPCTICTHPKVREINDALTSGLSVRQIAQRFGLPKSTIFNHLKQCLRPQVEAAARIVRPTHVVKEPVVRAKAILAGEAPSVSDVLSLTGLLDRVARSLERLEGGADAAAENEQPTALAALSGQIFKGIDTAAKLQGLGVQDVIAGPGFSVVINLPSNSTPPHPTRFAGSRPEPAIIDVAPEPVLLAFKDSDRDTI